MVSVLQACDFKTFYNMLEKYQLPPKWFIFIWSRGWHTRAHVQLQPATYLVINLYWNTTMLFGLHIVYDCFVTST
jgi:hypothetical protein